MKIRLLAVACIVCIAASSTVNATFRDCTGKSYAAIASQSARSGSILESAIMLSSCDQELMLNQSTIRHFLTTACQILNAHAIGTPLIMHTGDTGHAAGFRFMLFTKQGGCIMGSCINNAEKVYIRVVTHQPHNVDELAACAKEAFDAQSVDTHTMMAS